MRGLLNLLMVAALSKACLGAIILERTNQGSANISSPLPPSGAGGCGCPDKNEEHIVFLAATDQNCDSLGGGNCLDVFTNGQKYKISGADSHSVYYPGGTWCDLDQATEARVTFYDVGGKDVGSVDIKKGKASRCVSSPNEIVGYKAEIIKRA